MKPTTVTVDLPLNDALMRDIRHLCQDIGVDVPTLVANQLLDLLYSHPPRTDFVAQRATLTDYAEGSITAADAIEILGLDSPQELAHRMQAYGFGSLPKTTPVNAAFALLVKTKGSQG
jgi:hypothetical protein